MECQDVIDGKKGKRYYTYLRRQKKSGKPKQPSYYKLMLSDINDAVRKHLIELQIADRVYREILIAEIMSDIEYTLKQHGADWKIEEK